MRVKTFKTRIFKENEDLVSFICVYIKRLPENSILVITSKIVSVGEGRTVINTRGAREYLIKKESNFSIKNSWFSIKDNIIMPAAGIDESNANGKLILLPKDSFKSAHKIRTALVKKFKVKNLGVVIVDSNFIPLRKGAVGVALGYAGFQGIRNYIGKKDIFGRKLKYSSTNVPDSLATAAALLMGEADERQPITLITEAPVVFKNKVNPKELIMNPKKDMFYPILKYVLNEKKK